jgi:hypothetical protein
MYHDPGKSSRSSQSECNLNFVVGSPIFLRLSTGNEMDVFPVAVSTGELSVGVGKSGGLDGEMSPRLEWGPTPELT